MLTYLPYCGWFFVGPGLTQTQRVAYFCSWGLLDVAGTLGGAVTIIPLIIYFRRMLMC